MTESNELESIQSKFAAPRYNRCFSQFIISVCSSYTNALNYLKLCTLPESWQHLKALLFLIFTFFQIVSFAFGYSCSSLTCLESERVLCVLYGRTKIFLLLEANLFLVVFVEMLIYVYIGKNCFC
jgi:hypothetical protein